MVSLTVNTNLMLIDVVFCQCVIVQGDQGQRGIRGLAGPPGIAGPSGSKVRVMNESGIFCVFVHYISFEMSLRGNNN